MAHCKSTHWATIACIQNRLTLASYLQYNKSTWREHCENTGVVQVDREELSWMVVNVVFDDWAYVKWQSHIYRTRTISIELHPWHNKLTAPSAWRGNVVPMYRQTSILSLNLPIHRPEQIKKMVRLEVNIVGSKTYTEPSDPNVEEDSLHIMDIWCQEGHRGTWKRGRTVSWNK